jgi:hypothetical protein
MGVCWSIWNGDFCWSRRRWTVVAGVSEFVILPVENLLCSRSAQRLVRLIHFRQQCDIGRRVTGDKALAAALPGSHKPAFGGLADQLRHLRPAQAVVFSM